MATRIDARGMVARAPRRTPVLRALGALFRTTFFWQLAAMVAAGLAVRHFVTGEDGAELLLERWGILAPAAAVMLQTSMAALPLGSSLVSVANGAAFPLPLAFGCNITGAVLGAMVMYAVWRRGDRDLRIAEALDRLPVRARRFARGDFLSLVALRLLPWAGGNLANLLAGARGVPLHIHVMAAAAASLPGSLLYALLGAGVASL